MGQLDKDQLAAGSVQLWSPRRALSGAKAPSLFLAHSLAKQARSETHAHPDTQAGGWGWQKLAG